MTIFYRTNKRHICTMNKLIFLALLAIAALAGVSAAPADEFEPLEIGEGQEHREIDVLEDHLRFRRVTCDLMSFKGAVGHSACAANCLSMGKAGGSCNRGVCQCRKTNFKDLWKKRFG